MALRELALRRVADRVEAAARALPAGRGAGAPGRRARAGGGGSGCAGRAAGARRQAPGGCARCRVDRGVRGDPAPAAPVGARPQPAHRGAAARRVPRRGDRDPRRPVGRGHPGRVRTRASRHARHRRRAQAARLARLAAALDRDRAGAARAGLRRAADRSQRRHRAARRARARLPAARAALGPLRLGRAHHAAVHAAGVRHVPALRAVQPRDDLPARRHRGGPASRARALGADRGAERRRVRFLLRAAALLVRGLRCAVPGDLRHHGDHRAGDRHAHRQRAPADARGGRARAAHGAALRHEPRARRHARHLAHGARGGAPRRRSVPVPGGGAAAGRGRQAALPGRGGRSTARSAARISRWRSGWPITAGAPAWARTPCRPRAACTCRSARRGARWGCWRCCRNRRGGCCCRSRATCWRPLPGRSRWPWSARGSPSSPSSRASPPSARRCATRCWPPSRTICARRWR